MCLATAGERLLQHCLQLASHQVMMIILETTIIWLLDFKSDSVWELPLSMFMSYHHQVYAPLSWAALLPAPRCTLVLVIIVGQNTHSHSKVYIGFSHNSWTKYTFTLQGVHWRPMGSRGGKSGHFTHRNAGLILSRRLWKLYECNQNNQFSMLQETIRMYEAEGAFLSPEYQAMLKVYPLPPHRCVITTMMLTIFTWCHHQCFLPGHCRGADLPVHSANLPGSRLRLLGYLQLQGLCDHAGRF